MHSSLVRVQNVFGFFTTVAFSLGALIALSVIVSPQTPSASLAMRNVQVVKGRPHYYSTKKEEYAHVKFDLDADLTSLFSWNTKQVFVYVTATFPSKDPSSSPPSEAIIWDAIIPSSSAPWHFNTYLHPPVGNTQKQKRLSSSSTAAKRKAGLKSYPVGSAGPGILQLEAQRPKYQITTPWGKIGGAENCTLRLGYNIQPWVGALTWSSPNDRGLAWKGLKGERSETFDMPVVKKKTDANVEGSKVLRDELKTETGGERNRGSPA